MNYFSSISSPFQKTPLQSKRPNFANFKQATTLTPLFGKNLNKDSFEKITKTIKFGFYLPPAVNTNDFTDRIRGISYPRLKLDPERFISVPQKTPYPIANLLGPIATHIANKKPNDDTLFSQVDTYLSQRESLLNTEPDQLTTGEQAELKQIATIQQSTEKTKKALQIWEQKLLVIFFNLCIALNTDPLTKLWNRTFFDKMLEQQVDLVRNSKKPTCVSLAIIDLNDFKYINEAFSHDFGDYAIQTFTNVLRTVTPASSYACRTGGDEFAIIFPNGTSKEKAQRVFQDLQEALYEERNQATDGQFKIYLSCSYAFSQHSNVKDGRSTYKDADSLLAEVKRRKRLGEYKEYDDTLQKAYTEFKNPQGEGLREVAKKQIEQVMQEKRPSLSNF